MGTAVILYRTVWVSLGQGWPRIPRENSDPMHTNLFQISLSESLFIGKKLISKHTYWNPHLRNRYCNLKSGINSLGTATSFDYYLKATWISTLKKNALWLYRMNVCMYERMYVCVYGLFLLSQIFKKSIEIVFWRVLNGCRGGRDCIRNVRVYEAKYVCM